MELALDLIRDSTMTMIEIALETGYHHPASFTKASKSAFGI
jgi:transcriptional regulator GlxA family with amidase domain